MQQATKLKRISVYQVLEKLKTEQYFQIFAWVSLGVVLVSTFTFVLGTFPEFQKEEDTGQPPPYPEAVLVMDVVGKQHMNDLHLYLAGLSLKMDFEWI